MSVISPSGNGEWCVSRAHRNMVQLITRPPSLRDRDHCVEKSLDLSLSVNMAKNNMNEQEQLTSTVLVGRRWYTFTTSPTRVS